MMSKTQPDWCKYLSKDGDLYICLITAGKFDTPTSKEPEIPQEDYDYWLKVCQPYPDTREDDWILPSECGYTMEMGVRRIG
jgi:hypothetical protein